MVKNYRVAMSTLHESTEEVEWQDPSAHIANDPDGHGFLGDEQGFAEELEEENEVEHLGTAPPTVYYSMQDVEELHKEWQETHQQEIVRLQREMQSQLHAQSTRARVQQNLGTGTQNPIGEAVPMRQARLSTNAPVFIPGQGLGTGMMMFYNSTPRPDEHTQQLGSVSRTTD